MLSEYYKFRDEIVEALRRDLMGPTEPAEVLSDPPGTTYGVGVLFPQQSSDGNTPKFREDYEEDKEDPPVALANVKFPSSMGITFAVDTQVTSEIKVTVSTARYTLIRPTPKSLNGEASPVTGANTNNWQRQPVGPVTLTLSVIKPGNMRLPNETEGSELNEMPGLELFVRVRPVDKNGVTGVTLVLINAQTATFDLADRESKAFFQSKISVSSPESEKAPFVERPRKRGSAEDADLQSYSLLYRHAREFATGHGCSVIWKIPEGDASRATLIESEYIPVFRLPLADSNPEIDDTQLSMRRLSMESADEVCNDLEQLCKSYEKWINLRKKELDNDPELTPHRKTGEENIKFCAEAADRIRKGIELLRSSPTAWQSFVLMNRAMLTQRSRSEWISGGKKTDGPQEDGKHKWRPFQISFILMCIQGIADPKSENSGRDLADLLWFPTGGGKTEAYLGLIAFTIFYRRLTNSNGGGVTALMRYTLRLLTIQQFERAAILICACEKIRREMPTQLGTVPITLGVWLGKEATPLTLSATRGVLNSLLAGAQVNKSNPVQLQSCPWCGKGLDHRNYWIRDVNPQMVISCNRNDCDFGKGLPVFLIDEDVYKHRPTLIIATVDKFASLPWKEECAALFNMKNGRRTEPPPELIIQDELHLISGPLGTLTGLYETVVDALCTEDGIPPKVIASTATIRRAGAQAKRLFAREMRQFPPPALDARDSYFSVQSDPRKKGDRMYVGLMSPSTSHTTLLVRAYSALLQAVDELEADDVVKDHYWTLVGYFSSLRVLGGARMQVQDDVEDRMNLLASRHEREQRPLEPALELTSRVSARDIPVHLKELSNVYPNAVDVLLATNMISVGVDIDRLGLMAVMGQPQSTSEYIQSTSRVGRRYPGLVVTMYNSARSRDRSHYESFTTYHSALYRQVESTSVTPFSPRARDRALHAVVIALARLIIPELATNDSASIAGISEKLNVVRNIIKDRVYKVSSDEAKQTVEQVDLIINEWVRRAESGQLLYSHFTDPQRSLLKNAHETVIDDMFITLWSMRDVDQESTLYFI